VYLIHESFRRDLGRLHNAVSAPGIDQTRAARLQAHWTFVDEQLHHHHQVEDASLWPLVRPKLAGQDDKLEILDQMEAQHHALEPKCQAIGEGFTTLVAEPSAAHGADLAARILAASDALDSHLSDEEEHCFPVLDAALSEDEFASFGKATAKAIGMKGSAKFFPWIFDGASPVERTAVLSMPPPPVRILSTYVWEPRYTKETAKLWASV